jgi:hypothetical protein
LVVGVTCSAGGLTVSVAFTLVVPWPVSELVKVIVVGPCPFAPSSFQYQLSANTGSVNYSIAGLPNWLTVNVTVVGADTVPEVEEAP